MSPTEIDHSNRDHAEFGPSGLKYVAKCPGFQQPNTTSAAAEKGTRIHEALEAGDPSALHNEEEVSIYDDIVRMETEFLSAFPVEHRIDLKEIRVEIGLPGGQKTFGTCDRFTYWEGSQFDERAVMLDYKTGVSVIDPTEFNWQARAYVAGAFQKYPKINWITFAFLVPFHDDEVSEIMQHTFHRGDMPAIESEMSSIIERAAQVRAIWNEGRTPSPTCLKPTTDCRFCQYEDKCPALGALVIEVAEAANPMVKDSPAVARAFDPTSADPAAIEQRYMIAKIVEAWADREKRAAVEAAKAGMVFPNLKLSSMGAATTVVDSKQFYALAKTFGLSDEDLIELATFPLSKVTDALPKDQRTLFRDAAEAGELTKKQAERFTLKDK